MLLRRGDAFDDSVNGPDTDGGNDGVMGDNSPASISASRCASDVFVGRSSMP